MRGESEQLLLHMPTKDVALYALRLLKGGMNLTDEVLVQQYGLTMEQVRKLKEASSLFSEPQRDQPHVKR